jgi:hypothetical protein
MTRITRTITAIAAALALTACTVQGPSVTADDTTASPGAALGEAAADAAKVGKNAPPTAAKVGGSLTVTNGDSTATWTLNEVRRDKRDEWRAAPNGLFVSARITVKAISGDTFAAAGELALVTTDGEVIDQDYVVSFPNRTSIIMGNSLSPGQHSTGWVFFDVTPAQAKGAKLQLKQFSFLGDDPVGYWAI